MKADKPLIWGVRQAIFEITLKKVISKLNIENDHIGLYPRKGEAKNDHERPLLYILTIPEGSGTLNISSEHPLTASVKKQIMNGAPGGSWRYLVVKKGSLMFILGSINKSKGNRLLFFPSNYSIPVSVDSNYKLLDHISFEWSPKNRSHYTFRDGDHMSNGGLKKINENLVLWFTIFVTDLNGYIPLPSKINYSLDWPSSDLPRFSKEGVLANYKTKSIINVPSFIDGAHFHQIDVFFGSNEVDIKEIPNLLIENICKLEQPEEQPSGIAKIDITKNHSVFIKICERKGLINSDTLIMSSELI